MTVTRDVDDKSLVVGVASDTKRLRWLQPDVALALALAVIAFLGSLGVSARLDPVLYEDARVLTGGGLLFTYNIWFDGDGPKTMNMAMDRLRVDAGFAAKHPLHRPLLFAVTNVFKRLGLEPVNRLRAFGALGAALWAATLFVLLRLLTKRRLDAVLFTLLGLTSAAGMFWLVLPECYTLASVTIMWVLILAVLAAERTLPTWAYVAASAASLGITITNWMAGLLVSWFSQPWRRFFYISAAALAAVALLWALQLPVIPNTPFFLSRYLMDSDFVLHPGSGGPVPVLASLFSHTMVMPEIVVTSTTDPVWVGMITQPSAPGSGGTWSLLALPLWVVLLGVGGFALVRLRSHALLRWVLAGTLAGQIVLHLIYGSETFLYSLHFAPILITIVALATLTRWRRPVLVLTAALLIAGTINNAQQLRKAVDTVRYVGTITAVPNDQHRPEVPAASCGQYKHVKSKSTACLRHS